MDWGSQSGLVGPFSENLIIARHSGAFRDKISQMRVPGTGMSQSLDTNSQPKLLVLTQNAFIVKPISVTNGNSRKNVKFSRKSRKCAHFYGLLHDFYILNMSSCLCMTVSIQTFWTQMSYNSESPKKARNGLDCDL